MATNNTYFLFESKPKLLALGEKNSVSIALGMVNPDVATTGQKLKIDILGKMYDATILDESPYDPENNLLRA